jgi:ATP-binding cassette subfamily F protein 3
MVIAGLVSAANNLIVLDEPTNHLDIPSAERLEMALSTDPDDGGYDGSLILISHDRAMLAACCNRLLILDGEGNAREFDGNWDEWEEKEAEEKSQRAAAERAATEREKAKAEQRTRQTAPPSKPAPAGKQTGKQSGGDPKMAKMNMGDIEKRITAIEERTRAIDASLMDPKVYADAAKSRQLTQERERLQQELEPLEFEWSRRAE